MKLGRGAVIDDSDNRGSRPVPDPTLLTTQLVDRAIFGERERTDAQLLVRDERISSNTRDITHARDHFTHELVEHNDSTMRLVEQRFEGLAERTAEQKADTRLAIDAALRAAQELVRLQTEAADRAATKTEATFSKQIDALGTLLQKTTETTDDKIVDLKSRIDRLEAGRIGGMEQKIEHRAQGMDSRAWVAIGFAALLALVGVATFIIGIASHTTP